MLCNRKHYQHWRKVTKDLVMFNYILKYRVGLLLKPWITLSYRSLEHTEPNRNVGKLKKEEPSSTKIPRKAVHWIQPGRIFGKVVSKPGMAVKVMYSDYELSYFTIFPTVKQTCFAKTVWIFHVNNNVLGKSYVYVTIDEVTVADRFIAEWYWQSWRSENHAVHSSKHN